MKNYLFLGDTHDDLAFVRSAASFARQHAAEIIQVGDWGFLGPGRPNLEELSRSLVEIGVTLRFCDGNHDDHVRLKKLRGRVRVRGVEIAENVIYQPRGSVHVDEDGTRFLFLGGAPSIDRASRVEGESWWPEEVITEADLRLALSARPPIHVLVTHDAPAFPPDFYAKGSPDFRRLGALSMRYVAALSRHHRPRLHVHGHWHHRYERRHKSTRVVGLDCNTLDPAWLDDAVLLWSRDAEDH